MNRDAFCYKGFILTHLQIIYMPRERVITNPLGANGWIATRPSEKQIRAWHREHVAGKSVNQLYKETGRSRLSFYRWFGWYGLPARDSSAAETVKWSRMTKEQRQEQVRPAHDAARGSVRSDDEIWARAQRNQETGRMSEGERVMFKALKALKLEPIPQYAVERFNIDLALPAVKLAIEIDGGGWHEWSKRKRAQDEAKETVLITLGWGIVRIVGGAYLRPRFSAYADNIRKIAEIRRKTKPIRRKNGVIARYPKPANVEDGARVLSGGYRIYRTKAPAVRKDEIAGHDVFDSDQFARGNQA